MFRSVFQFMAKNLYVFLGILVGLYISSLISYETEYECANKEGIRHLLNKNENIISPSTVGAPLRRVSMKKVNGSEKKSKLVRPRYYSTELGIRQKLFVGIFSSEEKVNTQAYHLNATIGHLVDKIKFFITAQYKLKSKFNLTGLVGFTDTRYKYRPFQVFKYIGDTFGLNYDYYYLANDYTYINARRLNDIVKKISVSMDVYMGTKVEDSSFCNLDAGILLSNSVLKSVREHLDWCVLNTVSDDFSENIGRCIFHSIGLACEEEIQEQKLPTFKLKHFELGQHLLELSKRPDFNKPVTVYPILQADDFYLLNAYFLKQRLEMIREEILTLSEDLTENWPPGHRVGAKPATRHDLPRQIYFNMSHMFFPDDFTNIRVFTKLELEDIENILEEIRSKVKYDSPNGFEYKHLINGYRTFDLSRGMEYILDIEFQDIETGKEVIKRFQVVKPLGKVELMQVPYVTENMRVTILLPVQESEISRATEFINQYVSLVNKKERIFLMLVLLYQYSSISKGNEDVYYSLKESATRISTKYKNEDSKIAWVSIRLPKANETLTLTNNKILNIAIVDLALKKIGTENLILILDVHSDINVEFLNRVRLNTISNFQIFNPIPFRYYNPKISQLYSLEINKNIGHFDRESYKYSSFYAQDYINARKRSQPLIPLVKADEDIPSVLRVFETIQEAKEYTNVLKIFMVHGDSIHCMRATETGLKVRYHEELDPKQCNLFLGNEAQLSKLILTKEKQIFNVS